MTVQSITTKLELDCASAMFVLGRNKRRNYLIRLSATLREPIDPDVLQIALEEAAKQFPYFFIQFVYEGNRIFAQPLKRIPKVREKINLSYLALENIGKQCEAQVTYTDKTIHFEFFHGVSDGMGGMTFLQYLVAKYLSHKCHDENILKDVSVIPLEEQIKNGYRDYAKGFQASGGHGAAYHMKGTPDYTSITTYCLSAGQIRKKAKEYSVSITEYLAVLICLAIYNLQQKSSQRCGSKKIRLTVPVNLRTRFQCHTTRNFTLNVYPELSPSMDGIDLPTLCAKLHAYMKTAIKPERLAMRCAACDKAGRLVSVKTLPITVKRWLVQSVLDSPFTGGTMTFSNMGAVCMPEELKNQITDLEVVFSAKPETPYSCSAISIDDKMKLTLLRTIKEPLLESQLEKIFLTQNINIKSIVVKED